MKIDVLLQPCAISAFAQGESVGTLCVVFDVLRATSTMLTGLEWGVREFFVVGTIEAALAMREQRPEALLGGERGGDRIAGFDLGNSPLEYQAPVGRSVIMTTTNGTVALQACARASAVLVGAVVNLSALVGAVQAMRPQRVVAVCAGTGAGVALEDVWAAGSLVGHFPEADWSDAAQTAFGVSRAWPTALDAMRCSENGRALLSQGRAVDLEWCAQVDRLQAVGCMEAGAVRRWNPETLRA